ncbi:hypothetical protein PM082_022300 [Marasmius tenuissimus]|nr:hypothetical protein PM082_022300 [Marasmius tenuissimus]
MECMNTLCEDEEAGNGSDLYRKVAGGNLGEIDEAVAKDPRSSCRIVSSYATIPKLCVLRISICLSSKSQRGFSTNVSVRCPPPDNKMFCFAYAPGQLECEISITSTYKNGCGDFRLSRRSREVFLYGMLWSASIKGRSLAMQYILSRSVEYEMLPNTVFDVCQSCLPTEYSKPKPCLRECQSKKLDPGGQCVGTRGCDIGPW